MRVYQDLLMYLDSENSPSYTCLSSVGSFYHCHHHSGNHH